jgi:hypothetical protein
MTPLRVILRLTVALGAVASLAWASRVPITFDAPRDALLRLAWRARPDRVEDCRPQSADVLERLPPHMRQQKICEGTTAEYRLRVRQDDRIVVDEVLHAGGLRRDRPIYVFREVAVAPGPHDITVEFERIGEGSPQPGSVPPRLSLERRVDFRERAALLVTYDDERRELIAVERAER